MMFDFTNGTDIGSGRTSYDVALLPGTTLGMLSGLLATHRQYYETGHIYISGGTFGKEHEPSTGIIIPYSRGYKIQMPEWMEIIKITDIKAVVRTENVDYYVTTEEPVSFPADNNVKKAMARQTAEPVIIRPYRENAGKPLAQGMYVCHSCPDCGHVLGSGFYYLPIPYAENKNFCEECGKKLDWEHETYLQNEYQM